MSGRRWAWVSDGPRIAARWLFAHRQAKQRLESTRNEQRDTLEHRRNRSGALLMGVPGQRFHEFGRYRLAEFEHDALHPLGIGDSTPLLTKM